MPLHPTWEDIAIRLALTMLAAGVIGLNREARGHAAGFRTTVLVGLAASVAMIQMNLLLPVSGRSAGSFSTMDVMRLPLGVLTGVGFIGGGAILKRGALVTGITTAATLWTITIIGLCFGGGQLGLGTAATVLAFFALWALRFIDVYMPREYRARLVVVADPEGGSPREKVAALIAPLGYHAIFRDQAKTCGDGIDRVGFDIRWMQREGHGSPQDLVDLLERYFSIASFELISDA
jgi:putative Mg2+ transporter-C (MgtC) family protein